MKKKVIALCLLVMPLANVFSQTSESENSLPVDSGYVIVDGGKLYYEVAGKGPDIVLLHDGMVPCTIWDEQFQWLAKNYHVVRYDRRAYGKSTDPAASYSHIEDLNQVFTQLKIDNAIIFGMSSGGGLAIDYTLKYPEKVRGLVLVGAVVGGYGYSSHMGTRGGHMPPPSERADIQKVHRYFIMDDPYLIYKENIKAKERVMEMMKPYMQKARGEGIPVKRADRSALQCLPEIKVSTLILVGEYDIPDVHAHSGAINAGINGSARLIIPDSGHLIPIEQPKLFNAAVDDFLKWFPR
ncbi:MAG: alpha/beta hydrolase [Bacteroidales bacterium]